ncbi:Hsp70 family protein [Dictyobacter formicarum]|uniref:Molecular chaperone DnaK n=1 Tax=Dictyobacter formicarum TaxID=2778368 RepID=A0ABQ3VA05_9CHLR|nr:Hsp70 family protein [Dictyobacter formicarum]GHO82248.1 hypothetical protein KSZ_02540 [Dictyobacter formicarum]
MRLGIDFGTCFSSAAFLDGESITLVKDPASLGFSVPSSVFLTPQGQILVGKAANNQRLRDPLRHRREIKRDLGNSRPVLLGEQAWLPEQLVMHILSKIKQDADTFMTNSGRPTFTGAVITIPATYHPHKRDLMLQAAIAAGFVEKEITLLEEPVAAGLCYTGLNQVKNGDILLVYDLGGGTFDTALMQKVGGSFQYLATPSGLSRCGGADFDRAIYQDLVNKHPELRNALQCDSKPSLIARASLGEQCIDLKHQLREVDEAEISFVVPGTGDFIEYHLTRTEFNQMIATSVQETITCCQQMLQQANIKPEQINHILLVGGSCRIPYVQQMIQQTFKKQSISAPDLELVVCQGAGRYDAYRQALNPLSTKTIRIFKPEELTLLRTLTDHVVSGVAISPDGETLVSGSLDKTIKVWNLATGQLLHILTGHTGIVSSAAISPDGETLVSGCDEMIKVWRLATGQLLHILTGHTRGVSGVAISPDGETLVSGSDDKTIKVWNLATGQQLRTLTGHTRGVYSIAISPDGETLVSGSDDETIKVWDLATGQQLRTLTGHTDVVYSVAISPDGEALVSGSLDKTIKIWGMQPDDRSPQP